MPQPPVAPRRPHPIVAHGKERIDDWYWLRSDERPATGNPKPPFPPEQSIPALGRYLCAITPELWPNLNVSTSVAGAVAHRSSASRVNEWGGAPAKLRPHADKVAHWLKEYTVAGARKP